MKTYVWVCFTNEGIVTRCSDTSYHIEQPRLTMNPCEVLRGTHVHDLLPLLKKRGYTLADIYEHEHRTTYVFRHV